MAAGGFDFGSSYKSGFDNSFANVDRKRKDAAYNALRAAYGDIAGDPESAAKLQAVQQSGELQPGRLQAQQDTSANTQANTEATSTKSGLDARAGINEALYGIARGIKAGQAKGGDPLTLFDSLAEARGLPPVYRQQIRAKIAADPSSVDSYIAAFEKQRTTGAAGARYQVIQGQDGQIYRVPVTDEGAVNQATGPDGKPIVGYQAPQAEERNVIARQRLDPGVQGDIAHAKAEGGTVGKGEGEKTVSDLPLSKTETVKNNQQLDATHQSFDVAHAAIARAIGETGWLSAGPLSALPDFLNPKAAALHSDLITVQSKIVLDTISEMKSLSKTGSTGFGQLSDKEGQLISARLGAVMQATSPSKLRTALTDLQTQLDASQSRIQRAYTADLAARGQGPAPKAATPAARTEGQSVILKWNPTTGKVE